MAHTKVDVKGDASIAITHVRRKKCDFPRCLDRRRLQKRRVGALRGSGRKNQSRLRAIMDARCLRKRLRGGPFTRQNDCERCLPDEVVRGVWRRKGRGSNTLLQPLVPIA